MSWRIRWLIVSPVIVFIFGALILSCGSSSSPPPGIPEVLIALQLYAGSPLSPTPSPSPTAGQTASATPTQTLRPTATATVVVSGTNVPFGDQGLFEVNNSPTDILVQDLTNTSLFTSDDPTVLVPPLPSGNPGVYFASAMGCACVQASSSNRSTDSVSVGVVPSSGTSLTCGACPTLAPTPTPGAAAEAIDSIVNESAAVTNASNSAGVLSWTFDAGAKLAGQIATGANGTIYFITSDQILHAVDHSGHELFRRSASGVSPIVTSNGLIAYLNNSTLDAINPGGSLAWAASVGSGVGPVATSGDAIYVATSSGISSVSITGQVNWTVNPGSVDSAAASDDGVVVGAAHGSLTALAVDGANAWTFSPSGGFTGSLAAVGEVIYAGSGSGTVYAIDARTGKVDWYVPLPSQVTAGPAASSSGELYVTAAAIYAISPQGSVLWQQNGSPTADGPIVSVGPVDVFDAAADSLGVMLGANGSYVWSSRSFGTITTLASAAGVLYVGTDDGRVFAVR